MENGGKPGPSSLSLLHERLPQVGDRISRLFASDEDFRELCDEYEACARTITRFAAADVSSAGLRTEYAALLLRLERELPRYVEEHPEPEEG